MAEDFERYPGRSNAGDGMLWNDRAASNAQARSWSFATPGGAYGQSDSGSDHLGIHYNSTTTAVRTAHSSAAALTGNFGLAPADRTPCVLVRSCPNYTSAQRLLTIVVSTLTTVTAISAGAWHYLF